MIPDTYQPLDLTDVAVNLETLEPFAEFLESSFFPLPASNTGDTVLCPYEQPPAVSDGEDTSSRGHHCRFPDYFNSCMFSATAT